MKLNISFLIVYCFCLILKLMKNFSFFRVTKQVSKDSKEGQKFLKESVPTSGDSFSQQPSASTSQKRPGGRIQNPNSTFFLLHFHVRFVKLN
jgi:hypothetical protein